VLRLKDVEQFEKVYKEVESKYQRGEKALKADYESLQKVRKILVDEKRHIRFGDWNAFDIEVYQLLRIGDPGCCFGPLDPG
jgi:obg-like ATPase 1